MPPAQVESVRAEAARPQPPRAEAGLFLAVVAPWLIFAFAYFGQPIPQSVLAKSVVYRLEGGLAFRAFLVQLRTVFPFSVPPVQDPDPLGRPALQAVLPAELAGLGLWNGPAPASLGLAAGRLHCFLSSPSSRWATRCGWAGTRSRCCRSTNC